METTDPTDPAFDLGVWEAALQAEHRARGDAQRQRDAAWREELRTRLKPKDGAALGASHVSVPVPDPVAGAPLFVMVRDPRR